MEESTKEVISINTFGRMGKKVAAFSKPPDPESIANANSCLYTSTDDGFINFSIDNVSITNKSTEVNLHTSTISGRINFNNCQLYK